MISVKHLFKYQDEYIQACRKYMNGEMDGDLFFPKASAMGIYRQRQPGTWMVRARIPSGNITIDQLKDISKIGEKYSHGKLHLTTRQDIQFHGVKVEDTIHIVEELKNIHVINKGAGGNSIRNISVPPMSGISSKEVFDVTPYAMGVTEYILHLENISALPRKFKIAFSHDKEDSGRTQYADLGFLATMQKGEKGFRVYGGGGLGNKPSTGICIEEFIPTKDVLIYTYAMLRFFEEYGDRENRNKARMRFVRYRLGDQVFNETARKYIEDARKQKGLKLNEKELQIYNQDDNPSHGSYVELTPKNGDIHCKDIHQLIQWIEQSQSELPIGVRLTFDQGILVFGLTKKEEIELRQIFNHLVASSDIEKTLSCTGARECRIGLCNSLNLREKVIQMSQQYPLEKRRYLPQIFISGCRNSCGWHLVGDIGFSGKKIRTINGVEEFYDVYFAGKVGPGQSSLGECMGTLSVSQCIQLLSAVFDRFFEQATKEKSLLFTQYMQEDLAWIQQTIQSIEKEMSQSGKN